MTNEPETTGFGPWSAQRKATRNIRRGTLPQDEPDRSRTIKMARYFVDQRGPIPILAWAFIGALTLLMAVLGHHEAIWPRSVSAALGITSLSRAVVMFLRLRGARVVIAAVEADLNRP